MLPQSLPVWTFQDHGVGSIAQGKALSRFSTSLLKTFRLGPKLKPPK
jgi:hypothetical protein